MPLCCATVLATGGAMLCHYSALPVAVAVADGQRPHALHHHPVLQLHWVHCNSCCTAGHCMHHHVQGTSAANTRSVHSGCDQHHFQPGWPNYRQHQHPAGGGGQMNTSAFDRLLLYKRTTGSDGWISLPTFVWFQLVQVLPSI